MASGVYRLPLPLQREAEVQSRGPLDRRLVAKPSDRKERLAAATAEGRLETVEAIADLRQRIQNWRREGLRVGFVPTMGALHAGHLSLVEAARNRADKVVVSIFVNPTQFGPDEDLDLYPRQPRRDAEMLRAAGCDLLFLPRAEAIYPPGQVTWVEVQGAPALGLEADHRPGHFRGVATVVTLLLNLVRPDLAVFGEKDAQQLALVRRLVRDLHLGVEIVGAPIVREADGLAMSSRNAYLNPEERRAATVLHRALTTARQEIERGERRADAIRALLRAVLQSEPLATVEYAEVVDAESFLPVDERAGELAGEILLPLAVRIGPQDQSTRLLDNLQISLPEITPEITPDITALS